MSEDRESDIKKWITISVALLLVILLVTVMSQMRTYVDKNGSVVLLPVSDNFTGLDYVLYTTPPCPVGLPSNHTGALTCPVPSAIDEPDGNTSYVSSKVNASSDEDYYNVADTTLPNNAVIDYVRLFYWARENQTTGLMRVDSRILSTGGSCTWRNKLTNSTVWTNYTNDYARNCVNRAWTNSDVNSTVIDVEIITGEQFDLYAGITFAGVIVAYHTKEALYLSIVFVMLPIILLIIAVLIAAGWKARDEAK